MNNERIDLTQFEGLFEPNLLLHVFEEIKKVKVGFKDQTKVWAAKKPPIYFGKQTVDAIEMLPDLIAELKRCYEELDKWTNYATYIENVDMDCHKDASAEAGFLWKCTDCGAHFELPENGIYECEFGCDASE